MNARRILNLLFAIAILCAGATASRAQGVDVFLQGGASSFIDKNYPSTTGGPFGTSYSTGGQFSVGAEGRFGSIFGLEAAYGWGQNNLSVTQLGTNPGLAQSFGIRHQRASGDLVLHVPFIIVSPYGVAGIEYDRFSPFGYTHVTLPGSTTTIGGQILSPSNKVGFNYGGGLEFKVFPFVGLRLDVRDHVTGSPNFGLAGHYNATAHNVEYSAGIVVHFGK